MPFDSAQFMKDKFESRTSQIPVPGLADWFGDDDPLWTVRGQTANEVAFILEAKEKKYKNVDAIIKAIGSNADQINDLKAAIGVDYKTTPDEIVKRLEQLVQCSVEPVIKMEVAVKLAQTRPIEFFQLTNEITRLTGLGMDLKKSKASGA